MAGAGGVRVSVAFSDGALVASPSWDDITALKPNLVASYELERGREFELDYTDTGSYSIVVKDADGILDATNSSSPLYGTLEPDLQVKVELWNPVAAEWSIRFRGWIEDFDYEVEPFTRVPFLKLSCYDIFGLLSAIEMQPGEFGDPVPAGSTGNIFFDNATFQTRIDQVLTNALGVAGAAAFSVVFTGNVNLYESLHSPGENPMDVIQRALDGEFPGVSNAYPDRYGRLAAHGRLAKFDPLGTWTSIAVDPADRDLVWAWRHWKVGDGQAVAASPGDYAQMRPPFAWNRGKARIINSALASPHGIRDDQVAGQYVKDTVSLGLRGYKSWSKENLLTQSGILTGNNDLAETKAFAQYYVNNYAEPRNRVTALTVKTVPPNHATAARTWAMLAGADIADQVDVTVGHRGGGGFNLEPFFIEGIRETCEPLNGEYAMVTASYDVSPAAYFTGDLAGLDGS